MSGVLPPKVLASAADPENPNVLTLVLARPVQPEDLESFPMLPDQLMQLGDSAMRMELALRCIRTWGMADIALPDSGAVRDWIRDWMDGLHHGPIGGPLLWPNALIAVQAFLTQNGFERSDEGYVIMRRAPSEGESVQ